MKVTFTFDDGTEVTTKPENLVIDNAVGTPTPIVAVAYRSNGYLLPVLTFPGTFFNPPALKAHNEKVAEVATVAAATAAATDITRPCFKKQLSPQHEL